MGICYDIDDRFPEWEEFSAEDFDESPLFEDTGYPDLDDARREAAAEHPRGAYALAEVAVDLGKPDHFLGSDPTEMTIDVSEAEFIDEFSRYKWVAAGELSQFAMSMSLNMIEELQSWTREELRAFYDDVVVADENADWEDFDEFHTMVVETGHSPGISLLQDAFDRMVYPQLPEVGDQWVVSAPLLDRVLSDGQSRGAADLDDAVFEDMYRKAYVLQTVDVMGFSPWWNDEGIDVEMSALAHPRMRVSIPETGNQLVVGPSEAIAPASEIEDYDVPAVADRDYRLYPGGVLPKNGEIWLVSLPEEYEDYAGGVLPEDAESSRTMRATMRQNIDWANADIALGGMDGELADQLYHPLMDVELDDGTELVLPPVAFMNRVE